MSEKYNYFWVDPIAQLAEYKFGSLNVTSSSSALGTGRHGPPAQPVMKLVTGQGWHHV